MATYAAPAPQASPHVRFKAIQGLVADVTQELAASGGQGISKDGAEKLSRLSDSLQAYMTQTGHLGAADTTDKGRAIYDLSESATAVDKLLLAHYTPSRNRGPDLARAQVEAVKNVIDSFLRPALLNFSEAFK